MPTCSSREKRTVRGAVRRLQLRRVVDRTLDWTRFQLDALVDPVYLPGDHLPRTLRRSIRAEGTRSRWDALRPVLEETHVRDALDLGCNTGWFVVEMAKLGIATLGIENHPAYHRTALYAMRRSGLKNVGVALLTFNEQTLALLPEVDCVLFLSLWHHLVHDIGFAPATTMLHTAWQRSRRVLVFETVESSAAARFGVPPMLPDGGTWLRRYLTDVCPGARIVALGAHPVPREGRTPEPSRTMFALVRDAEERARGDSDRATNDR